MTSSMISAPLDLVIKDIEMRKSMPFFSNREFQVDFYTLRNEVTKSIKLKGPHVANLFINEQFRFLNNQYLSGAISGFIVTSALYMKDISNQWFSYRESYVAEERMIKSMPLGIITSCIYRSVLFGFYDSRKKSHGSISASIQSSFLAYIVTQPFFSAAIFARNNDNAFSKECLHYIKHATFRPNILRLIPIQSQIFILILFDYFK